MTYSLDGLTGMGTVTSEEHSKDAGLFQTPLPGTDSKDAIALDLFGTSRTIRVKGVYTTTNGTISTFIGQLDALCNGNQTVTKTFVSDKSGVPYEVLVTNVNWSSESGAVTKVDYSIDMLEASQ